jgi:hypothetical protein
VTCDNFFSSRKLARYFLGKKTTFLGTMRRNKKELPDLVFETRKIHDTLFYDDEKGCMLTIYQGKKDKNVTLLSSFHEKADIPDLNNAKRKRRSDESSILC